MSPRRSSRARSSHLPSSTSGQTNSAASSTSTKPDRSTRSVPNGQTRGTTPRRASTVRSESIEDTDSTLRGGNSADLPPRRSRRGNDAEIKKEKDIKLQQEEGEDEVIEEDVTRCICGQPEYPGPGASVKEQQTVIEPVSDDVGNFFVQCDKCHVWQHGGCMGLTDESMLPDEYYCELCKPEYHRIIKSPSGMKSSRYLPVLEGFSTRSSPLSSTEAPRKGSGKNKPLESTKRRATMNSRGAYDEEEMLKRAIEESKEQGPVLGKRLREDGEDQNPVMKRQRTGSSVSSLESRHSQSPQPTTEDSVLRISNSGKISNKLRGAAAKNSREKELREKQKEQIAVQRAEAANKRHARSERRRGDESPPPTPSLSPSKAVQSAVMATKPKADTPPSIKAHPNRKGGRPPARRGRLGRNQYTRDLPLNGETSDSPLRDTPDDRLGNDSPRPHTNGFKDNINGESGRSSKAKTHPARTSMNEMKRRVAAILEFVGRMQTESSAERAQKKSLTGEGGMTSSSSRSSANSLKGSDTPSGKSGHPGLPTANLVKAITQGLESANEAERKVSDALEKKRSDETAVESNIADFMAPTLQVKSGKDFDAMNSMEMMENITKDLVAWQSLYGTYTR